MTDAPKRVTAKLFADLRPVLEGWTDPVAFGVGWDGAVYATARRSAEVLTETLGHGEFPKSTLDASTDYLVVRWMRGEIETLVHRGESLVVSYVQPFPGGVLLVGARCHWRPEGAEKNAVALDWSGREMGRFTLGDGIADLRVNREGAIWVSYFDEGVFGNYGWSRPGPTAIGAAGLVAFSPSGEVRFSYDATAAHTDAICDTYAMNLANDGTIWLYFYTEFPIVRIRDGQYHSWNLGVSGARALAVREDRALLFGDYKPRSLGRVIALQDAGDATVVEELRIEGASGETLDSARAVGIGDELFLLENRQVMVVEDW